MRYRSFVPFILVVLFLQAAIISWHAEHLLARPVHVVPGSRDVPAPQVISNLTECAGYWQVGLTTPPRSVCLFISDLTFDHTDLTLDPGTLFTGQTIPFVGLAYALDPRWSMRLDPADVGDPARPYPHQTTFDPATIRSRATEGLEVDVRAFKDSAPILRSQQTLPSSDMIMIQIPIPIQIDYQSWMGFGWLGGSTFPTTTATLHYEPSPWVLQYWRMNGTYVDHVTEPPIADPTSGWGVRVGYVDRDAMYYAGYDSLDYRKGVIVHAGPVIGVKWGSPLRYDVTVRLPYTAKLGNNYQPAWGVGLRVEYDVPLGESVSLSIGYQAWNYWFSPRGWHYWDGVSISLQTRP